MSIVRIGLAETKGFAEGYDAIFGGKKQASAATSAAEADAEPTKKPSAKKKPAKKAKKK